MNEKTVVSCPALGERQLRPFSRKEVNMTSRHRPAWDHPLRTARGASMFKKKPDDSSGFFDFLISRVTQKQGCD
jgi:hypothetical protein